MQLTVIWMLIQLGAMILSFLGPDIPSTSLHSSKTDKGEYEEELHITSLQSLHVPDFQVQSNLYFKQILVRRPAWEVQGLLYCKCMWVVTVDLEQLFCIFHTSEICQ